MIEIGFFLWALFLGILVFGWKLMLLFFFLTICAGILDYQALQERRKKQMENESK